MFLTPSSYKVSTRLPYFAGNGKSPETAEPAESSALSTNHPGTGDTFQLTKQALPTTVKAAKSALTHLLQTDSPASETPDQESHEAQPPKSARFAEESAENLRVPTKPSKSGAIRTTVAPGTRIKDKQKAPSSTSLLRAASTLAASSRQHGQEAPPEIQSEGNLPFKIWQAMQEELRNPDNLPTILVTPHIAPREQSPHSSLILPSRTYSRISTRPSSHKDDESVSQAASMHENEHYLEGDSDLNSEDLELFHDEDNYSDDEGSAIYDDDQIIETREARKKAKSEKGAGTYSSAAPSVISEIRQNPHYLPGDSDLDSEDLDLYHDIDDESDDDAESDYKSSVGKSANIPIGKSKASTSDLFPIKSPEEKQQQTEAFQMAHTLRKGQLSQTLPKGGIPELISSYQQQTLFEKRKAETMGAQQITQAEQEKIIKICNNYPLEKLRFFQKDLGDRLRRWQHKAEQVAHQQGINLADVQRRDFELEQEQTQINFQLEQLSLISDDEISRGEKADQRKGLIRSLETAIQEKTILDGPLEAFKPITIGMDQIRLKMRQVNEAIVIKLRHQLKDMPKDAHERIQLSQNLSKTFTTHELGATVSYFKGKQAEAVHTQAVLQDIVTNNDPQQLMRTLRKQQAEASQEMILLSKLNREQPTDASESRKIFERINDLRLQQQKASTGLSLIANYLTENPSKQQVEHKIKFSQAQQHYISDRLAVLEKAISFQTVK